MNIENLNIDLDLLKFDKSFIMDIPGKAAVKRCVCIPIEDNDIYVSKDDATGKAKAAYLHLTAWKSSEEKFGQTHYVRQSLSQEFKDNHSSEEIKQRPILGNGKPVQMKSNNAANSVSAPTMSPMDNGTDDLPF